MTASFTSIWADIVSRHSQKAALSGPKLNLTYQQLDTSARQVAAWFNKNQVRGRCVAILMDDPADSVICMLGILLSGNYYFYPGKNGQHLADYLAYIDLGAIVKTPGPATGISVPELVWGDQHRLSDKASFPAAENTPYFAVFSTSGSTGVPKLVRHTVDFIVSESFQSVDIMQITANDRRDYAGSLTFSASLGAIYPTLIAGAELILHSVTGSDIFDLPRYWQETRITLTSIPVSVLRILAKSEVSFDHLENLRLIVVTAEAASAADMELFAARLPQHVVLMNGYATTETRGISILAHRLTNVNRSAVGSVGRPVAGKSVRIIGEQGQLLPPGQPGEIVVEAHGLPEEYLNDQAATLHSFYRSTEGVRQFRTGDVGYLNDDGYLFLEGRTDDVIKINGIKVNLQDIEKRLYQYPGIREAAVVVDKDSGRIYAWFVADDGITVPKLRRWLIEKLSPIHIPAGWTAMDILPKTATGKTDRARLQTELAAQKEVSQGDGPTQDELTCLIMKIWKKELALNQEIGIHDDFFTDLGGNSLLAAVCIHEIEELTGLALPLGAANTYSTPTLLAGFIKELRELPAHCVQIGDFDADRPSLYFIPPYPGDRRTYHHLETRLAGVYNLFFLFYNPVGPSGKIVPLPILIDSLADRVTVSGPIHLMGFSFGGILAYLVAMRLEEQKKPISFLQLLDTPLYQKLTRLERSYNLIVRIVRKVKQFALAPAASWNRYVRHFGTAYQSYRENFTHEKYKGDPLHPAQVIWHYSHTFPPYKKLKAQIVLFAASERGGEHSFRQDFSWQRYTDKPLRTVLLTGWHVELLSSEENLDIIRDTLLDLNAE